MTQTTALADLKQRARMPAKQAGGATVRDFFEANKGAMASVLPKHANPDRMLRIALTAIRNVPQLMECTTESLMGAVMQCALLGLEPNTPLGHAYMVPFRNRKKGITEVQVIPGYKGLLDLARRSGQIVSLNAHAVYERDEFDFQYGLNEELKHLPFRGADRGELIAVYAVAHLKDGGHQFEVMWREQIDAVMLRSQSRGEYGPWKEHYEEMARKTAIRRLSKYLPLSIEFATATTLTDITDQGMGQNLDQVLTGEWTALPPANEEEATAPDTDEAKQAAEWPQSFTDKETGEVGWVDSSGEYFDRSRHGWSEQNQMPAMNQDGTFRKRRGTASAEPTPVSATTGNGADGTDAGGMNLE
ncbi:MAG: recombination protein RecT [Proteobacteria bacterium]|nr:MAG: recombination protein RecT [Pseudomonadota bacterium]